MELKKKFNILMIDDVSVLVPLTFKTAYQSISYLYKTIPHFCYQKFLYINGNCRMCLIQIDKIPKPVSACSIPITNNLKILTKTPFVQKARENVLEFLLLNHPLDCPVCDQGGECDLQELSMNFGHASNRNFLLKKQVTNLKQINSLIYNDFNKCIKCMKCVGLSFLLGDQTLVSISRSVETQIFNLNTVFRKKKKNHELSSNLLDVCPVNFKNL